MIKLRRVDVLVIITDPLQDSTLMTVISIEARMKEIVLIGVIVY